MSDDPLPRLLWTRTYVERLVRDHLTVTAAFAANVSAATTARLDPDGHVEWTAVESAALRRIASQVGRYQTLIDHGWRSLEEADRIRQDIVATHVDTTRAVAELRCDGYDNPACERTGVQDVWVGGHNHWLCQRCWDRYRQAKRREGVA